MVLIDIVGIPGVKGDCEKRILISEPEVQFELSQWSGDGTGKVHLSPSMVSDAEIDYAANYLVAQVEAARKKAKSYLKTHQAKA